VIEQVISTQALILRPIGLAAPFREGQNSGGVRHTDHGDAPLARRQSQLTTDEGIVEASSGRGVVRRGEKDARRPGPVDRPEPPEAALAGRVEIAAPRVETLQAPGTPSERQPSPRAPWDRRCASLIGAVRDRHAVLYRQSSERTAIAAHILHPPGKSRLRWENRPRVRVGSGRPGWRSAPCWRFRERPVSRGCGCGASRPFCS